jgi:N-methylhydantoinase B
MPSERLHVDSSLRLHTKAAEDIDPITYQVLRSRFWHLNLEHGDIIKRVSGSPLVVWTEDFNVCLVAENGDTVVSGPAVLYFTGMADLAVKWTLEYRSGNPGIEDGDIFIQNDCYIAAPHHSDTSTYSPIFWEGELFCWVFNMCHLSDVGGVDPGSFCVNARDFFDEPPAFTPVKLARRGELQADIAELFARQSRVPDLVSLQLRSQIAGLNQTRQRLLETIERYGADVVKGAMRRMIKDCSTVVGTRLAAVPDGEWSETVYTGCVAPGDRRAHRESLAIRKVDQHLICSNEGTEAQSLSGNSTFSMWRSALITAASVLLASDQLGCPAGVVEHMQFQPTPGTRSVAKHPAAVSSLASALVSLNLAYIVLSKMLFSGPDMKRANASGAGSTPGWWVVSGADRHGKFVTGGTVDAAFGGIGAFADRDGMNTAGSWVGPRGVAGNAEEWESAYPILYLYRKEKSGSGGAGRYRGGNGAEIAIVCHKVSELDMQIVSNDPAVNATRGLAGALPGHAGNHRYIKASSIRTTLSTGSMPRDAEELATMVGPYERVASRSFFTMLPDDVMIVGYSGGGGVGDPLDRQVGAVLQDVRLGNIDTDDARTYWGVVVAADSVDEAATASLRAEMRAMRLTAEPVSVDGAACRSEGVGERQSIAPALDVVSTADGQFWSCHTCERTFGPASGNFKLGTLYRDIEFHEINPEHFPMVMDFCDDDIVLRAYYCPGCATQLSVDVRRRDDGHLWDVKLA